MIGQIISHYKILDKLGEGGMGEVYKAEDTKLKRTVALKFLPSSLSTDPEAKKRFIHEAQSASALDHTNICIVHEIGEAENGKLFISMACYEGETLKDKIRKGRLNIDEALDISLQICEGLKKAHQNNIIHRDIKPANIFITNDGIVKILDFGLAKVKGQSQLTQTGTTIGTIDYMSPEQARGEEVNGRTDIWSLGVVIYEMITGKVPFRGDYDQAVIYSILNEEPDLTNLSKEISPVIKTAIAKSPKNRYQSIDDLINDLISLKTGSKSGKYFSLIKTVRISTKIKLIVPIILLAAAVIIYFTLNKPKENQSNSIEQKMKMIVVLPFENLGPPEDEYLADGVRDEISNKLSSLSSIGVISRSSAEKYSKSNKSAKEIGKELGVDYILEGTMRWAKSKNEKSRIRIIPQLVRVSDDINIWSESFDKVIDDIFDVQNEIAQNVVDKLGIKLLPNQSVTGPPPTRNLEAYDYYLKAVQFQYKNSTDSDILTCIKLHEKAIELDSNFAEAYAQVSIAYEAVYTFYINRNEKNLEIGYKYLQKAKELKPDIALVHLATAFYYQWNKNDSQAALQEVKRTLEIQPSNAEANHWLGLSYALSGRISEGLKLFLIAATLDPLVARYQNDVAHIYSCSRDYKNAYKYIKKAIELSPKIGYYYIELAKNYIAWKGDINLAKEALRNIKDDTYLEEYENLFIKISILERDFDRALIQLRTTKKEYLNNYHGFMPNSQMMALVYKYKNKPELSKAYFDTSRIEIERMIKNNPEDKRLKFSLSTSYAGLGEKGKAIVEMNKQISSMKNEFQRKYLRAWRLTIIYILTGDYESALKQIALLLSTPNQISLSVNEIKLDPFFDPLRNLPEYKTVIERYSN